jgi:hypothetical protein
MNGRSISLNYYVPEDVLLLNGTNIFFVCDEKYLGVYFNRRMARKLHNERTVAKALSGYIRTCSLFKVSAEH